MRRAKTTVSLKSALEPKPEWRGWLHAYGFFVSLGLGIALVAAARTEDAVVAASIYAFSLSALLGTSALYHRVHWSETARAWMRRLDHTMILVLIAGTYTPFAMLAFEQEMADAVMWTAWSAALVGGIVNLTWIGAPKWLKSLVYTALAWMGLATVPAMWTSVGVGCVIFVLVGGVLYTAGAIIYAVKRPNPAPLVFGYHEIFHALVLAAALAHYAAVAIYVIPAAS